MSASDARTVVVTSVAAVSPAGRGADALWAALDRGEDLLRPIDRFDPSPYECRLAATVPDAQGDDAEPFLRQALDELRRGAGSLPEQRVGLALGTTLGGMSLLRHALQPRDPASRPRLPSVPYHGLTDRLARDLGLGLPAATVSGACASSLIALGLAFLWIRSGRADAAIAGGYDRFGEFVHAGFAALHALTADTVRPFDLGRSGIVLGEGAGLLLLEEERAALRAGREPLARLLGFACTSDANHITGPHPRGDGLLRAVQQAAALAGAPPDAFDYVMAHGTGTVYNDRMESIALRRFFPAGAPPLSSIKSMIGHALGAAGALECVAALRAMEAGRVPPTIHFAEPDPECDVDPVPNASRPLDVRTVLKTASGFGGQNAALVFRKGGSRG